MRALTAELPEDADTLQFLHSGLLMLRILRATGDRLAGRTIPPGIAQGMLDPFVDFLNQRFVWVNAYRSRPGVTLSDPQNATATADQATSGSGSSPIRNARPNAHRLPHSTPAHAVQCST